MEQKDRINLEKWRQVSKAHFSKITPYYDQGRAFEQGRHWVEEIQQNTPAGEDDWVLDAGCGTGLFATEFAHQMDAHVLGMDATWAMLQQAFKKKKSANLTWTQGTAEVLPLADRSLQVIFLSQVWHHIIEKEKAAREFHRCLKSGGGLYIKTYSHEQLKARWDLNEIFPELMPLMLSIYPDNDEMIETLEATGFAPVTTKATYKEDLMRPSNMLKIMHEKAWSMFSFLSEEGALSGEARLRSMVEAGDLPVPYPEVHLLVIAHR